MKCHRGCPDSGHTESCKNKSREVERNVQARAKEVYDQYQRDLADGKYES
jgi:hypothetical protein